MTPVLQRIFFLPAVIMTLILSSCELREKDNWIIECGKTTAMELEGEWPFSEVQIVTNPDTLLTFSPDFCVDSICESITLDIAPDQKYFLSYKLYRRVTDTVIIDTLKGTETGLLNYNYCYYENPDADPNSADFKGRNLGEIVFIPDGGIQYVCDLEFNDTLLFAQRLRIDSMELSVTFRR